MTVSWKTVGRAVMVVGAVLAAVLLLVAGYALHSAVGPGGASRPGQGKTAKVKPTGQEKQPQMWTCAMHPQIRKSSPGKCPLCGMTLVPVKQDSGGGMRQFAISAAGQALMDIETSPVEQKFVTAKIRMVGKVAYDETRLSYITAWVPGRIDRLFVDYTGITVKAGDHMVTLYSPELLSAQEELLQALKAVGELGQSKLRIMRTTATATVKAVREKLRLWGLTKEQVARIEQRGTPSDHVTIYAPAGGIVIQRKATLGMYVDTGTRIYTIADLSKVWVEMDAYESDLQWLRYGQNVVFTTETYPGERFQGRISFISPILDPKTRTVNIRVNVDNAKGHLKPDMFVRAFVLSSLASGGKVMAPNLAGKWICPMHPEIVKDSPGKCDICGMALVTSKSLGYAVPDTSPQNMPLVIPASAPLVTGTRAIVYVTVPDADKPTYEGREILLGPRAGNYYIVRHGLAKGELVVTQGNFKIDSALQIQAKPSMMSPEGGGGGMTMGGMNMGKGSAAGKGSAKMTMKPPEALPAEFQKQIRQLGKAYREVSGAMKSNDLKVIRAAFGKFQEHLQVINSKQLADKQAILWNELAMLLGNDAAEGYQYIEQIEDARRVFDSMERHMKRVKTAFARPPGPPAAPRPAKVEVPPEFPSQLKAVWAQYQAIHKALAGDDAAQGRQAARSAIKALGKVETKHLKGPARILWRKQSAGLGKSLGDLAGSRDIETLRRGFARLSEELAQVVRTFGLATRGTIYRLRCPMAFNNNGAFWLQNVPEVSNPYLGASMTTCGSIVERIPGGQADADGTDQAAGGPHHE